MQQHIEGVIWVGQGFGKTKDGVDLVVANAEDDLKSAEGHPRSSISESSCAAACGSSLTRTPALSKASS